MLVLIIFNIVLNMIFGIATDNLAWISCSMVWVVVLVDKIIDKEKDRMIEEKEKFINELYTCYLKLYNERYVKINED